jgi:TatD DNase family protein
VIVDSHAHLDALEDLDGALARALSAGVERVVTIGVDAASSEWAVATAVSRPEVWATVGLHPHDAKDGTPQVLGRIEELASEDRVVGVGETGLDFYYDNSPRDEQRRAFREQIAIAKRAGKALVIHCRDAWEDTFAILEGAGPPGRLVFHCFSGGPDHVERALGLGAVLSFSGTVTFRNAGRVREAAAATPLERIVVETDAPFLTPHPHRGRRNEPAYVRLVAEEIARVKGVAFEEVASVTTATARALLGF